MEAIQGMSWRHTIRTLFLSSRPVSWVNTAYPFAAGYLATAQTVNPLLIIGTFYFLIPYNLMMYGVNDVFDYESDIKNPRKGGVEGAVLARTQHKLTLYAVIATNVPFLIYLFWQGSLAANVTLAFVVFMVLAYSLPKLRFKERPFIDSFTSATHFAGPLLYALVLAGWQTNYAVFVVAFVFWGMASHAFGAVQDVIADRKGDIASVATVIGARRTVHLSAALYAMTSLLLFTQGVGGIVCGLVNLIYVANVLPFWLITDRKAEMANVGWKRFLWLNQIAGFTITMVLIVAFIR